MIFQNIFDIILNWLFLNLAPILVSAISIIIGFIMYRIIKSQLNKLSEKDRLRGNTAKNLSKLIKYLIIIIVISAITIQFSESIGLLTSMFTIIGGTIIGFAAMNTLGNMIAGIIIMVSKPFTVGDRIIFNGRLADVSDINIVYTQLTDLDNIKISVPNQNLLSSEIENLGVDNIIRRGISVTPGFEEDRKRVEEVLLNASKKIPYTLNDPEPYVWIKRFQSYAVEYNLFIFIKDIKNLPHIESELHKKVLDECKENNIDISTPTIIRTL